MNAILQTTFWNGLSSVKIFNFDLIVPIGSILTMNQHWSRRCLGAEKATSINLNECWEVNWPDIKLIYLSSYTLDNNVDQGIWRQYMSLIYVPGQFTLGALQRNVYEGSQLATHHCITIFPLLRSNSSSYMLLVFWVQGIQGFVSLRVYELIIQIL